MMVITGDKNDTVLFIVHILSKSGILISISEGKIPSLMTYKE